MKQTVDDVEARLSRIEKRVDLVELKTDELKRQAMEDREWLARVEKEASNAKAGLDDMRLEMSRAEPRRMMVIFLFMFVVWWLLA